MGLSRRGKVLRSLLGGVASSGIAMLVVIRERSDRTGESIVDMVDLCKMGDQVDGVLLLGLMGGDGSE
jgi:hypothetical protein